MNDDVDRESMKRNDLRRQRWMVLGVIFLLLGAVALPHAFRGPDPLSMADHAKLPPPLKPSPVGQFRGLRLQLHSNSPSIPFEKYVDEAGVSQRVDPLDATASVAVEIRPDKLRTWHP